MSLIKPLSTTLLLTLFAGTFGCGQTADDFALGRATQAQTKAKTRLPGNDRNWQDWVDCQEECRYDFDKCLAATPGEWQCQDDKLSCDSGCDAQFPPDWTERSAGEDGIGEWNADRVTDELRVPRAELGGSLELDELAPATNEETTEPSQAGSSDRLK